MMNAACRLHIKLAGLVKTLKQWHKKCITALCQEADEA
jgi:hypothetical protein